MSRPTKAQSDARAHYHHLAGKLLELEAHLRVGLEGSHFVPEEWREIARRDIAARKVKVTLRLDEDVVRFFRLMGVSYLQRMNDVLRAFMHARLAGVVKGAEAVEYRPNAQESYTIAASEALDKLIRRNIRARQGRDVEDEDVELHKLVCEVLRMQDDLDLPEEDWIIPRQAIERFFGAPAPDGPTGRQP